MAYFNATQWSTGNANMVQPASSWGAIPNYSMLSAQNALNQFQAQSFQVSTNFGAYGITTLAGLTTLWSGYTNAFAQSVAGSLNNIAKKSGHGGLRGLLGF
jgi:hypothetical protein